MEGDITAVLTDERLTEAQRNTLTRFARAMQIEGRTHQTRAVYLYGLVRFTVALEGTRLEDVGLEEFERFMLSLHEKKLAASTIKHEYATLHRFYWWLGIEAGDEEKYLKVLKRVRYKAPAGERHVIKAEQLPTREEVMKVIKFAVGARDKALIAAMYDLGTRPHELLNLNVGDVVPDEHGAIITVGEGGKTGARTLRPIFAVPYIREWLESHPQREQKDAPLFISFSGNSYGERLTVGSLRRSIAAAARRAGVAKHLYSYLFRHTAITREAGNGLGDQELKTFFGWTPDSQMLRVYSHLTSEDVNRKRLEQAGIIKPKEKARELTVQTCHRCGLENTVTAEYCSRCASPLNEQKYRELTGREAEITALKQEVEKLRAAQEADVETVKAVLALPEVVELFAKQILAKKRAT